jgi:sugar O-acyltransferase (sialic acid O-acetyltransferase NeuD family)
MTNYPLFILGSSGHAKEIESYSKIIWPKRKVFFVDDWAKNDETITVSKYHEILARTQGESIIGSGSMEIRRRMIGQILPPFATIIYPTSTILGKVSPGCVIAPGAVVAPNACLAEHVLINYNATIGHDTTIGQLTVISPCASIGGWCTVEKEVYIGAGALIRERLSIERGSVVGMGAVVTKNVKSKTIVIGNPANFYKDVDGD